jgi:hypothetical protein
LAQLANAGHPDLAVKLAGLVAAVADHAASNRKFAGTLIAALGGNKPPSQAGRSRLRSGRRPPGPFDPFEVHAESGIDGLRNQLANLDVEQLKDIIAEHAMDHDRSRCAGRPPTN